MHIYEDDDEESSEEREIEKIYMVQNKEFKTAKYKKSLEDKIKDFLSNHLTEYP